MQRVRLVPLKADAAEVLEQGAAAFEEQYGIRVGDFAGLALDVARQTVANYRARPREAPWGGYWALDAETGDLIGVCGFKDGPADGAVEIAYFTFPPFEGRGYATAMAAELVALAQSSPAVRQVIAHTLPERNASCRVLQKSGLCHVGEVMDPEDGKVWRWELGTA